jgi:hypothetical protein
MGNAEIVRRCGSRVGLLMSAHLFRFETARRHSQEELWLCGILLALALALS